MKENQNIEWKETWRDEYLRWICGFANAHGGTLIIGKDDKGVVTGLANAKKLLEDIPNKIKDILGIIVDVNLKKEKGKEFIEIKVDPFQHPVNYKGEYHYRTGSTKQELRGRALDAFLLKKYGLHWDGVPQPLLTAESLDSSAISSFLNKAVKSKRLDEEVLHDDIPALLKKLHLFEGKYLKRAAALLFNKDPEEFILGAYIKIGFFKTDSELIFHDEIHGSLFHQADAALDILLTKYMKAFISYEGIQRVERFLLPVPALRESLLNAIVHKDYSSGNPIQISVYENKVIFWNSGKLPEDLSIEMLHQKHPSIPYNPLIASAFFRAGYIESWGRGIEKINEECRIFGIPAPLFNDSFGGLMVEFKANSPAPEEIVIPDLLEVSGKTVEKTREETVEKTMEKTEKTREKAGKTREKTEKTRGKTEKTVEKTREKTVEKTRAKILNLIAKNPAVSTIAMANEIGITVKGIEWQIQKLKNENVIERIGPDKRGYWKIIEKGND